MAPLDEKPMPDEVDDLRVKTCKDCGQTLPIKAFPLQRNTANGGYYPLNRCADCYRAYKRAFMRDSRRLPVYGKPQAYPVLRPDLAFRGKVGKPIRRTHWAGVFSDSK